MVVASQILGLAFFKAGKYPQCYSVFGGERRGAPVVSFLRVDKERILLKCDIKQPNEILYFDMSLIDAEEICDLMPPGGRILISTNQPPTNFEDLFGFKLGLIDAPAIAQRFGLGHVINTAVLGAYCRFTGHFPIEHLVAAIEVIVPAKKEENVEAARQGYAELTIFDAEC